MKKAIFAPNFPTMKKTYKVAGLKFAVVMPDNIEGWNNIQNYEPFLTEHSDDCIFVTENVETLPDISEMKKLTTCCSSPFEPRIEVYEGQDCYQLDIAPNYKAQLCIQIRMNKDFSKAQFQIIDHWQYAFNIMMKMMFAFAAASKSAIQVHSSVTMKDGKGYMFLGLSGTGKSTHSQLWINNIEGCSLLNDDNPVVRIGEDGIARVYGSPWSGKTPCYRNLDVPIGAIVKLSQAKENAIRRLPVSEAYAEIYASFSGMKFVKALAEAYHATNLKLVTTVPFYHLCCLPNAEAAFLCYETVKL